MTNLAVLRMVVERLVGEGLVDDASEVYAAQEALAADPNERPLPWYMRLLVTLGGWLTAFFVLFWLTFGVVCTAGIESGVVVLVLSTMVGLPALLVSMGVVLGPALYEKADARRWEAEGDAPPEAGFAQLFARTMAIDFFGQVAVAGVLAAQGGFAVGVLMLTDEPWLVAGMLLFQSVLLLSNPHYVLRFTSAALAGVWAILLFDELGLDDWMGLVLVLALLGFAVVWLTRPSTAGTRLWRVAPPMAHGLAGFVVLGSVLTSELDDIGVVPVGYALVAVLVAARLLGERRAWAWLVASVPLLFGLAAITAEVPGIVASGVLLVLGLRFHDRVSAGLGVLGLLGYGLFFWVIVDIDPMVRSASLGAVGAALLGVGWGLSRAGASTEPALADGVDPARRTAVGVGLAVGVAAALFEVARHSLG